MVTLSDEARGVLDRYLRHVRLSLKGHSSVDANEVERDVRGHIEAELAGQPEPIGAARLREVLDRLGAPGTWVPDEELPGWRRVLGRLRAGPEDWRLAYLTFAGSLLGPFLFLAGPFLWPLEPLLVVASFFMARATLTILADHDEPVGGRRWLIYPILIFGYLVILVPVLVWPAAATAGAVTDFPQIADRVIETFRQPDWLLWASFAALALGIWWTMTGFVVRRFPIAVRYLFFPFAEWFDRRHGSRLAIAGIVVAVVGAIALAVELP
jgi:hypothetical protein